MRKILSLFAMVLLALAANATVLNIAPDSPQASDNIRREIRDHIQAGDTLMLADGVYTEADVVELNKDVVIMAAEGAHPIVKQQYYMKLLNSAKVTIIGVKFDGSLYPASDHCVRAYDATEGKTLTVIDCEFTNFPNGFIFYPQKAERCQQALTIKNCRFSNFGRSAVYVETGSSSPLPLAELTIENSTFMATTPGANRVVDLKNGGSEVADAKLRIDHCTFYNCNAVRSEKSTDVIVKNSIFAAPEGATYAATTFYAGAAINNCLTFNVSHAEGPTVTAAVTGDPLFADAANLDLTLGEGSPALTAAEDGGAIGDPRWAPAPAPIGAPEYFLVGTMNNWTPADEYKFEENPGTEGEYMLTAALAVGDSLKVLGIVGATQTWYPDNAANYGIDAAHAGESKKIYFRPNADGGEGWYHGVIFVEENQEPDYQVAVLEYTGGTTTNLVGEGANNAEILGLDANLFTVLADKGENQNLPGLNQANDIRLYADKNTGNGNSITVSIANGTILSIALDIKQTATFVVKAGETAVTEAEGVYAINGTSFSIQNTTIGATTQLRLNKITINYTADEPIIGEPAYFLVGTMNEWTPAEAYKFEENPGTEGEYMLTAALAVGDSLKVLGIVGATQTWYPDNAANYGIDAAHAGESKKIYFRPNADGGEGWYHGVIFVEENQEPAGCDWDNIDWFNTGLAPEDENYNQFKICKDGAVPNVENIQVAPWADNNKGIYISFTTAVIGQISLPENQYKIQGAGVLLYLSAFTAVETEVTMQWEDGIYTMTVYNKNGVEPAPEPVYSLWKVVATTDTAAGAIYVDNEYVKVQTVYQGKVSAQNAILFDEAYTHIMQVRVEDYPTAEVPTGTKRADCTPLVFTAKQDASIAIYYLRQAVNKAWTDNDNKDVILFDQAAPTVKIAAAKMEADSVLADSSYYFMAKSYNLQAGHTYTLTAKGTTIKLFGISYPAVPEPEHTYTAVGDELVFGSNWKVDDENNDMEKQADGTYKWTADSIVLIANTYAYKIVKDHSWAGEWPVGEGNNKTFAIAETGYYDVTITFNPEAAEDEKAVVEAVKVGDAVVIPTVAMHGDFSGSWKDTELFTNAADSSCASLKLNLEAKTYEFGMRIGSASNWTANSANLTRENPSTVLSVGATGNMHIVADQAGEYTFTYFYDADSLVVTYPAIPQHYDVAEAIAAQLEDSVQIYVRGIVTKISFKGKNFDKYGSANIFVADATGAEGEFEFFNCYSLNADTFRTSSPDYDAASTSWAEFNSVADENGVEVALGDTIEAFGKFKLYGNTYELLTGCYITVLKKYVEPIGAPEYFLVGTMNEWEPADGFKFEPNPGAEGEYMLTATLGVGDSLKVLEIVGNTRTYYPDLAPNYGVDSLHAGESKKIYFRPDGQGGEGWYFGYFFVEENQEPADTIPTTAPAAPTAADDDVLAIYCGKYTNNLNYVLSGWAGGFEDLMIDSTRVGYRRTMTWECIIDPVATNDPHDVSGYKKVHFDIWVNAPAKVKFNAEDVVASVCKDGPVVDLVAGWNSFDYATAEWPTAYDFKTFKCFTISDFTAEGNPMAFANIYFYEKEAQGFENIDASVKAVKVLQNGQIFILRGDKVYTVTGQPIAK